jgi:molybdopterin synthase sulfur carrier subunit
MRMAMETLRSLETWRPLRMTQTTILPPASSSTSALSYAYVLFFGRIADRCGRSLEIAIPRDGCTVSDLKALVDRHIDGGGDALGEPGLRASVDQVMCADDVWVLPGQEVAFLSAFSGG